MRYEPTRRRPSHRCHFWFSPGRHKIILKRALHSTAHPPHVRTTSSRLDLTYRDNHNHGNATKSNLRLAPLSWITDSTSSTVSRAWRQTLSGSLNKKPRWSLESVDSDRALIALQSLVLLAKTGSVAQDAIAAAGVFDELVPTEFKGWEAEKQALWAAEKQELITLLVANDPVNEVRFAAALGILWLVNVLQKEVRRGTASDQAIVAAALELVVAKAQEKADAVYLRCTIPVSFITPLLYCQDYPDDSKIPGLAVLILVQLWRDDAAVRNLQDSVPCEISVDTLLMWFRSPKSDNNPKLAVALQIRAMFCLSSRVAKDPTAAQEIFTGGGVGLLLAAAATTQVLPHHDGRRLISVLREYAVCLLAQLATCSADVRRQIVADTRLFTLIQMSSSSTENGTCKVEAIKVMCVLLQDQELTIDPAIVNVCGVPLLLDLWHHATQQQNTVVVAILELQLFHADNIPYLVGMLLQDAQINRQGAIMEALAFLAKRDVTRMELHSHAVVDRVVDVLCKAADNKTKTMAAQFLVSITHANDGVCRHLVQSGALVLFASLLSTVDTPSRVATPLFGTSEKVWTFPKIECAMVLTNLVKDEAIKLTIVSLGASASLADMVTNGESLAHRVAGASLLGCLASTEAGQSTIVVANVIPALVALMHAAESAALADATAIVMYVLVKDCAKYRRALVLCGGKSALEKGRHHKPPDQVMSWSARLLAILKE